MAETGRVDFYLLAEPQAAARLRFACRLAEKAWHLDNRVHLLAGSAAEAASLDELLWTFRQGSFVPHELVAAGGAASAPVTIGHGTAPPPPGDLLINLAASVPAFEDGFARVAEIVDGSDEGRRLGRERYREYRQRGREAVTHDIGTSP